MSAVWQQLCCRAQGKPHCYGWVAVCVAWNPPDWQLAAAKQCGRQALAGPACGVLCRTCHVSVGNGASTQRLRQLRLPLCCGLGPVIKCCRTPLHPGACLTDSSIPTAGLQGTPAPSPCLRVLSTHLHACLWNWWCLCVWHRGPSMGQHAWGIGLELARCTASRHDAGWPSSDECLADSSAFGALCRCLLFACTYTALCWQRTGA